MRERRLGIAALLLVACGSGESAPAVPRPVVTEPPVAIPTTAEGAVEAQRSPDPTTDIEPTIALPASPPTAEPPVVPAALPTSGLPDITTGPALRIDSTLPVTTRQVGTRTLAAVTLADPTAQANLDAWFEEHAWCRGRVQLAIDGLVSYVCSYSEPAGPGGASRAAMNVRITESGEVQEIAEADFFLAGTDLHAMIRVWVDDGTNEWGEVSFGPGGAVIVPSDTGDELVRIPWRRIAPYVRRDGPLGPALLAAGLTLAPAGTQAPPLPIRTTALIARGPGHAIGIAARLPAAMRAGTRLRVDSTESIVLLPADADLAALPAAAAGTRQAQRHVFGPLAELVTVLVDDAVEIHESAGPRTPVIAVMPAGTVTVAARGALDARVSEPGTSWVLVSGGLLTGGYVQGRHVALLEGCGAPTISADLPPPTLTGYAELDSETRFAWTLTPSVEGTSTAVALFPVSEECAIGPQARRVEVPGAVTAIRLVAATADGAEWLTVITTAADLSAPARTVSVFGPTSDAPPAFTTTADAPTLRFAERRGPSSATGYFPVVIASGRERTHLTWSGTAVEAVTSTAP